MCLIRRIVNRPSFESKLAIPWQLVASQEGSAHSEIYATWRCGVPNLSLVSD